jgi:hypothetical protein
MEKIRVIKCKINGFYGKMRIFYFQLPILREKVKQLADKRSESNFIRIVAH